MIPQQTKSRISKSLAKRQTQTVLTALGLMGAVTGCNTALAQSSKGEVPVPQQPLPVLPTLMPTPTPLAAQPAQIPAPVVTPWPTATPWPTPTPWPTVAAWQPKLAPLPTLAPVPVVQASFSQPGGSLPISYSPPDGVDVFGSTILRWTYPGVLAEDEYFDIKIKPLGSNDSVFVDWSKSPEYTLHPWSGWQPGLYTWQIGIIKGSYEGEAKNFIADTGHDSQPFLIKWQASGGGGGGGSSSSNGGGGGGGKSGGS
ncbi:MAG: hypothetical protein HS126_15035 [Anaerolineales bacterium]|nr:hypothetical protein [Anaerolineales bacterium]